MDTPPATVAEDLSRFLSCGVAALYGSGGFPGFPGELRALGEREASCGAPDFLGELFPAATYRRPAPHTLGTGDAAFREHVARIHEVMDATHGVSPASSLFGLDDAVLRNNVLFAGPTGARRVIFETARRCDRADIAEPPPAEIRAFPATDGPVLFLGSVGSANYGHWLIDDLPRLRAVERLRARHPTVTITIVLTRYGRRIDAVRKESIRLHLAGRIPFRVVFVGQNEAHGFARIHYASPVSHQPLTKSPGAVRDLVRALRYGTVRQRRRLAFARGLLRGPAPPLKLFVDRRSGRTRRLLNRDEIVAGLKARGFTLIDTETMSVARQVSCFTQARLVVGVLGAAMTNTAFCRPGTPLIYLAPEGWFDPFFWDLAAIRGHPYHALFGQAEAGEGVPDWARAFSLPWASLETALDRAERADGIS